MTGRVLIVAGSDSGGGAGIQADIKTVTVLGGYAASAITALTVQNTMGVHDSMVVPPEFVAAQMRVVLEDIGADALKTGMLPSAEIIEAVVAEFRKVAGAIPLVVDPVMVAKGGARLVDDAALRASKELLLPLAAVLTPNLPEASQLTGRTVESLPDMLPAAEALLDLGPGAVLLKGGHLPGDDLHDLLLTAQGPLWFESQRIATRHTHGTGCTMASALACSLAQGLELGAAVERARAYVQKAIGRAPGLGQGHGPLGHFGPA